MCRLLLGNLNEDQHDREADCCRERGGEPLVGGGPPQAGAGDHLMLVAD